MLRIFKVDPMPGFVDLMKVLFFHLRVVFAILLLLLFVEVSRSFAIDELHRLFPLARVIVGQGKVLDVLVPGISQQLQVVYPFVVTVLSPNYVSLQQSSDIFAYCSLVNLVIDFCQRKSHIDFCHSLQHVSCFVFGILGLKSYCRDINDDDSVDQILSLWLVVAFGELHKSHSSHGVTHQRQLLLRIKQPLSHYELVEIISEILNRMSIGMWALSQVKQELPWLRASMRQELKYYEKDLDFEMVLKFLLEPIKP